MIAAGIYKVTGENMKHQNQQRRMLLKSMGGAVLAGVLPRVAFSSSRTIPMGETILHVLSDGYLSLPANRLFDSPERADEAAVLFEQAGLSTEEFSPPLNITLLQSEDKLVLFDLGSGSQFLDTAGLLPSALESIEVDPADVTDVVFTHAHPDHCWGLLDDFDDLLCPEATYHMHGKEFDHWMSEDTLNNSDEGSLAMVAGARNRLPLIEDRLQRFNWGDELLPGVEAVDSRGHTPGHTSFAIHQGNDSVMVLGDALIHPVLSFQRPDWPWITDQNTDDAVATRKRLLDRLFTDKMQMIGYHLPESGVGSVEQHEGNYHYVVG